MESRKEFKEKVISLYATIANDMANEFDSDYTLTREVKQEVSNIVEEEYGEHDLPDRTLRNWTSQFRHDGKICMDIVERFLEDDDIDVDDLEEDIEIPEFDGPKFDIEEIKEQHELNYIPDTPTEEYNMYPFPNHGGQLIPVLKEVVEYIIDAYSRDVGRGVTVAEIAAETNLAPKDVENILKCHNKYHYSDRFTEEQKKELGVKGMLQDTMSEITNRYKKRLEREKIREYKRGWKKYHEIIEKEVSPFEKVVEDINSRDFSPLEIDIVKSNNDEEKPLNIHVAFQDLHLGAMGLEKEHGENYNLREAEKRVLKKCDEILPDLLSFGIPEKFTICLGGDYFHICNPQGTTNRGTALDHSDTWRKIIADGYELAVKIIDIFASIAPVEVISVEGNHDRDWSRHLIHGMKLNYKNCDNVDVIISPHQRQYLKYGDNLIGYYHGMDENKTDLFQIMANEGSEYWSDTKHRILFIGHTHHLNHKDMDGVLVCGLPSLAATDDYHKRNGFFGSVKGLAGYVVHKEKGIKSIVTSVVN